MAPKRSELEKLYGPIVSGVWPDASAHTMVYHVPRELLNSLRYRGANVYSITVNKDMYLPLKRVFDRVIQLGWESMIKSFDGCYSVRLIRGGSQLSAHAYALAIDINAATNQLGTDGDMDQSLVQLFDEEGFTWGGEFRRKDPMHFQYLLENP